MTATCGPKIFSFVGLLMSLFLKSLRGPTQCGIWNSSDEFLIIWIQFSEVSINSGRNEMAARCLELLKDQFGFFVTSMISCPVYSSFLRLYDTIFKCANAFGSRAYVTIIHGDS